MLVIMKNLVNVVQHRCTSLDYDANKLYFPKRIFPRIFCYFYYFLLSALSMSKTTTVAKADYI